jgi:hypothetical protein
MPNPTPGAASTKSRRSKTPPAVSAAVAKLIAQVQAEAEAATLAALSAKDGILVLQPLDAKTARLRWSGDDLYINDGAGGRVRWYRQRTCPESWVGSELEGRWHPSHHDVYATRVDGLGREWDTCLGTFITDDFGYLVEVQR